MRKGFKVYDSDTHVNPAADVLDRYVDSGFREWLPELEPHRIEFGTAAQGSARLSQYRVGTKYYRRVLGTAEADPKFMGRGTNWKGSKPARPRVQELPSDMPANHPSLEPLWKASQDYDLAVVHHSFTWNPPDFPGYQDLWDTIFLGRLASHPWGAMRFVASFVGAGIMDRYTDLRMGILECGYGWLPFWSKRMDEQATYVGDLGAQVQAERVPHQRALFLQPGDSRRRGYVQ